MLNATLVGHVVFITGASSGIGEACALHAAQLGATVVLTARRESRLKELAEKIKLDYKTPVYMALVDVTEPSNIQTALDQLPENVRDNISILINNAGLALGRDPVQSGDPDEWDQMISTNVNGLLYVTRAILPGMLQRQRGHVINIGSIAGEQTYPGGAVYCATKHAVRAISSCLKHDLLGTPIRVTNIEPGMVETEFSIIRAHGDVNAAKNNYANMTPLMAGDIADAVFYAATRPLHVNVSNMLIMPADQSSVTHIHRR